MPINRYLGTLLSEQLDATTGLYTRYNPMGGVEEQRPLSATELDAVQAHDHTQAEASAVAQAQQQVDTIQAQSAAFQAQIQADIATVQAGWQTLDAATQTAILLRILNGFTSVLDTLFSHAAITGAIDPLAGGGS